MEIKNKAKSPIKPPFEIKNNLPPYDLFYQQHLLFLTQKGSQSFQFIEPYRFC